MLDSYELTLLATEINVQVVATCRVDPVVDTNGTQAWSSGSSYDCVVGQPGQGNALDPAEYTGSEPGATIWLPASISIKAGDRIVDNRNGNTYKVMHVPSIHTDELRRPCICVEIRTPGANA